MNKNEERGGMDREMCIKTSPRLHDMQGFKNVSLGRHTCLAKISYMARKGERICRWIEKADDRKKVHEIHGMTEMSKENFVIRDRWTYPKSTSLHVGSTWHKKINRSKGLTNGLLTWLWCQWSSWKTGSVNDVRFVILGRLVSSFGFFSEKEREKPA